jgi:hypothetical protein
MRRLLTDSLDRGGLAAGQTGAPVASFVYIDDFLCSGFQFFNNVDSWLEGFPPSVTIDVILVGGHRYGQSKRTRDIAARADTLGKSVTIRFWSLLEVEDRFTYRDASDVLWPMGIPRTDAAEGYANHTNRSGIHDFEPRTHRIEPAESIFDSASGRANLERVLLLAGLKIRGRIHAPKDVLRPLGWSGFGLGHGTMVANYRNCPNNAPLAIWWSCNDWQPLLPRKTNEGIDGY